MMPTRHLLASLVATTFACTLQSATAQAPATESSKPATTQQESPKPDRYKLPSDFVLKTFHLTNISQGSDANEVLVALRNMLAPGDRIFLLASQNAIVIEAPPEQMALAQKLLNDLDRPKKTYRLTYTLTDYEADRRIGTHHYTMIVVTGQRTTLKQGSKVPVQTGTYNTNTSTAVTQLTYLDIGMNFDATLDDFTNGVRLQSKVEQSSVSDEKSALVAPDPIVRQVVLQGTSFLTPGKPLVLGSVDVPGTTRHIDITVAMELVS